MLELHSSYVSLHSSPSGGYMVASKINGPAEKILRNLRTALAAEDTSSARRHYAQLVRKLGRNRARFALSEGELEQLDDE